MKTFWSYKKFANIPKSHRLTLGEGCTPLGFINYNGLIVAVKDENMNPNGSFKDRSIAYQLSFYTTQKIFNFVISSSGNAAISACAYAKLDDRIKLEVFVSKSIASRKLDKLKKFTNHANINLHMVDKPKSDAVKFARDFGFHNLSGSRDDIAMVGYNSIVYELMDQYPKMDAIFIPASSGTGASGLLDVINELNLSVKVYLCQTEKIHSIAKFFDKSFEVKKTSLADAIVDRVALRKRKLIEQLQSNKGGAFVISDEMLKNAKDLMINAGYDLTFNSTLGFAGLMKYLQLKGKENKINFPVVIATGL